jgi:hypothetical protein
MTFDSDWNSGQFGLHHSTKSIFVFILIRVVIEKVALKNAIKVRFC